MSTQAYQSDQAVSPEKQAAYAAINAAFSARNLVDDAESKLKAMFGKFDSWFTSAELQEIHKQQDLIEALRNEDNETAEMTLQALRVAGMVWP